MLFVLHFKTDIRKDTENLQTKSINLRYATNLKQICSHKKKLQEFLFVLAKGHISSTQILNYE